MNKKFVATLLAIGTLFTTNLSIALPKSHTQITLSEISDYKKDFTSPLTSKQVGAPVYEHLGVLHYGEKPNNSYMQIYTPMLRSSYITVNVTSPCDEKFRKNNTYWMRDANDAVERADNELGKKFSIDFVSVAQKEWTSSSTNGSALLGEAINKFGLVYEKGGFLKPDKKADLMIAFTGLDKIPSSSSDSTSIAGIARLGNPYALIKKNTYATMSEVVQHEVGHTYGLSHSSSSGAECVKKDANCVMHPSRFGLIDKFCATHETQWKNAKSKYGK